MSVWAQPASGGSKKLAQIGAGAPCSMSALFQWPGRGSGSWGGPRMFPSNPPLSRAALRVRSPGDAAPAWRSGSRVYAFLARIGGYDRLTWPTPLPCCAGRTRRQRSAPVRSVTVMRGNGKFVVGGNWKCAPLGTPPTPFREHRPTRDLRLRHQPPLIRSYGVPSCCHAAFKTRSRLVATSQEQWDPRVCSEARRRSQRTPAHR